MPSLINWMAYIAIMMSVLPTILAVIPMLGDPNETSTEIVWIIIFSMLSPWLWWSLISGIGLLYRKQWARKMWYIGAFIFAASVVVVGVISFTVSWALGLCVIVSAWLPFRAAQALQQEAAGAMLNDGTLISPRTQVMAWGSYAVAHGIGMLAFYIGLHHTFAITWLLLPSIILIAGIGILCRHRFTVVLWMFASPVYVFLFMVNYFLATSGPFYGKTIGGPGVLSFLGAVVLSTFIGWGFVIATSIKFFQQPHVKQLMGRYA